VQSLVRVASDGFGVTYRQASTQAPLIYASVGHTSGLPDASAYAEPTAAPAVVPRLRASQQQHDCRKIAVGLLSDPPLLFTGYCKIAARLLQVCLSSVETYLPLHV
jgi:hypothetical protein